MRKNEQKLDKNWSKVWHQFGKNCTNWTQIWKKEQYFGKKLKKIAQKVKKNTKIEQKMDNNWKKTRIIEIKNNGKNYLKNGTKIWTKFDKNITKIW